MTMTTARNFATAPRPRRWTREEYERAFTLGLFGAEERLELIAGEIIEKMPQKPAHATTIGKVVRVLMRVFGEACEVRSQLPLILAKDGEPEPDVLVVPGEPDDYGTMHPTESEVLLLVEVSDRTLEYDLGRKAAYYAEAGIANYWVVDGEQGVLHLHRNPVRDEASAWGFRYGSVVSLGREGEVSPLARPEAVVIVGALLPVGEQGAQEE